MATLKILERRLGFPMAEAYDRVRGVEQKVKGIFPDAEFVFVVGSDDALHLRVYSSAESMRGVIQLVEGELESELERQNSN